MNFENKNILSIIVSTYNGANKLPVILSSLQKQSFSNFELLVVVDGSTDETMKILKEWENKFADFKIIYQQNKGRAAVRNTGAKNAKGDWLLFFDDDLMVHENCVKDHVDYQVSSRFENIFVGDIIEKPVETAVNNEFVRYKKYIVNGWYKTRYAGHRKISEHLFDGDYYLAGANFSISKSIFNKIGGLDETLNRAEDYEFAIRAKAEGIQIILGDKFATVKHLDTNNDFNKWVLKARYGEINNALAYAKDQIKFKIFAPPEKAVPNIFKRLIFKSLANKSAYNFMVSNSKIKKIIPANILYRSYDLIVAANSRYYPHNIKL